MTCFKNFEYGILLHIDIFNAKLGDTIKHIIYIYFVFVFQPIKLPEGGFNYKTNLLF